MKQYTETKHMRKADKALLEEINRYFDCLLSDEEEQRLRRKVASASFNHPLLEEAKALMGFSTIIPPKSQTGGDIEASRRRDRIWKRTMRIAAAVALLISIPFAIKWLLSPMKEESQCVAYVNGQRIVGEEAVLELVYNDMKELNDGMRQTQNAIIDDMEELATTAECFESEFDPLL